MGDKTKSTAAPSTPTISFVGPSPSSSFSPAESPIEEARIGLFDAAFTQAPDKLVGILKVPGDITLRNEAAENDNYVGSDSRRFYLRVVDPNKKRQGIVEADWWTSFQNSTGRDKKKNLILDDPGSRITLFETGPETGVFVSRALMLVGDMDDRSLSTNSGIVSSNPRLKNRGGQRKGGDSDYRIRHAGMHSFVVASYPAPLPESLRVKTIIPVFKKTPVLVFRVQVYILRIEGQPVIDPAEVCRRDLDGITKIYNRIAVTPFMIVSSADRADSTRIKRKIKSMLEYELVEVDPPPGVNPNNIDIAAATSLANAFPAEDGKVLRLFFVGQLNMADMTGVDPFGITFGITLDRRIPSYKQKLLNHPQLLHANISFVQKDRGTDDYTAAHELGHLLTDKDEVLQTPITKFTWEVDHYETDDMKLRPDKVNLMNDGATNVKDRWMQAKRLWDTADAQGINQFDRIRNSRFV